MDPRYNALAHAFLLNASGGAATFVGATALTETVSDTTLGERLKLPSPFDDDPRRPLRADSPLKA